MAGAAARAWSYDDSYEDDYEDELDDDSSDIALVEPTPLTRNWQRAPLPYQVVEAAPSHLYSQPWQRSTPQYELDHDYDYDYDEEDYLTSAYYQAELSQPLQRRAPASWPVLDYVTDGLARLPFRRVAMIVGVLVVGWLVVNFVGGLFPKETEAARYYGAGRVAASSSNSSAPSSPATGSKVMGGPTISAAKIEAVLRSYNSPAAGKGQAMYDLGVKYGIDPAYALAFFVHESTAGTAGVAVQTKSIGNIRWTAGYDQYGGFRKYATWEAGMEDWYKLIKDLYVEGWKLDTVEKIIPKYAPAADNNSPPTYIAAVNKMVADWRSGK